MESLEQENSTLDQHLDLAESMRNLIALVKESEFEQAEQLLHSADPQSRVWLLSRLSPELQNVLLTNCEIDQAAEYLHEMPEIQAVELLDEISPEMAADILEELPKDEQADLVGELSDKTKDAILSEMEEQDASVVRTLIEYDDEEAGGIMIVDFVAFDEHETVGDVVNNLRSNVESYSDFEVQYVYVVNKEGQLLGVLRLRDLLLSPAGTTISEVMIQNPLAVKTSTRLKELHAFFADHHFIGVPVVTADNKLVGVLRRGHVEEAMSERYADYFRKTQGIVSEELRTMPVFLRARRRLAWLSANILLNIIAASVIAMYQETLTQVIALAVFLPIISDMSGCSGNQAVAVSMRELSLGLVNANEVLRVWIKEVLVGLLNGFALGLLGALAAYLWKGNIWLGAVVGAAMFLNTIVAVSLGGTLPLFMRLLKLDPALASGPILTTITDMCGFFLVLGMATMFLQYIAN